MRKEFTIDLNGVQSEIDIILRFAKVLHLTHGGLGWSEKSTANWNAFIDDMRNNPPEVQNGDEVIVVIKGVYDIKNRKMKSSSGEDLISVLSEILLSLTDPSLGPNTFKLYPQFILS